MLSGSVMGEHSPQGTQMTTTLVEKDNEQWRSSCCFCSLAKGRLESDEACRTGLYFSFWQPDMLA